MCFECIGRLSFVIFAYLKFMFWNIPQDLVSARLMGPLSGCFLADPSSGGLSSGPHSGCFISDPSGITQVQGASHGVLPKEVARVLGLSQGDHLKEVAQVLCSSQGGSPSTKLISGRPSQGGSPEYKAWRSKFKA